MTICQPICQPIFNLYLTMDRTNIMTQSLNEYCIVPKVILPWFFTKIDYVKTE